MSTVVAAPEIILQPRSERSRHRLIFTGLAARQAFVCAVATYDVPYYYPAPLNLVPVLFVRLPAAVLALFGRKSAPRWLQLVEKILWRLCVAPLAFVFNGLWLWNLRAQ